MSKVEKKIKSDNIRGELLERSNRKMFLKGTSRVLCAAPHKQVQNTPCGSRAMRRTSGANVVWKRIESKLAGIMIFREPTIDSGDTRPCVYTLDVSAGMDGKLVVTRSRLLCPVSILSLEVYEQSRLKASGATRGARSAKADLDFFSADSADLADSPGIWGRSRL